MMTQNQVEQLEVLADIRKLMDRSSRFISLSGLSGVAVGVFALIGISLAYLFLGIRPFQEGEDYYILARSTTKWGMDHLTFFFSTGIAVLVLAIISGIYFTRRKAKRKAQKMWDALTQRLLINLLIPLIAGGIFCLGLYYHGATGFVAPITLIFYGLALINASKYTLSDIRYLGYLEIGLGLLATFYLHYGLEFWALGFGILHILYGTLMYYKYEREAVNG